MTQLLPDIWEVEMPEDAWCLKKENWKTDFVINMGYLLYPVVGKAKRDKVGGFMYANQEKGAIKLPPGNWTILFTTDEMTEDQAAEIVTYYDGWADYEGMNVFDSAIQSFHSLLRSKGLETDKNYLILQNKK